MSLISVLAKWNVCGPWRHAHAFLSSLFRISRLQ